MGARLSPRAFTSPTFWWSASAWRNASIGTQPAEIGVLDVRLDGPGGRQRALGGHIDGDPSQPLVTIRQVEGLPSQATFNGAEMAGDTTNLLLSNTSEAGAGAGQLLKITVHCQEGDLSNSTSGRQMEIEFGVRFGL